MNDVNDERESMGNLDGTGWGWRVRWRIGVSLAWERAAVNVRLRWVSLVLWAGWLPRGWHASSGRRGTVYRSDDGWCVKQSSIRGWRLVTPTGNLVSVFPRWSTAVLYAAAVLRVGKGCTP